MQPNTDKSSIHAQFRPPSKSLGGHFFFNLWHKLGTEIQLAQDLSDDGAIVTYLGKVIQFHLIT